MKKKLKRLLLIVLGFALLALGAVGVALPVLPTTPFVLLAAACFSASSEKFYARLRSNRVFGPYIEHYHKKTGVRLSLKLGSIAFLWAGLGVSMVMVQTWWVYIILGAVGIGVTVHLLAIKTKRL